MAIDKNKQASLMHHIITSPLLSLIPCTSWHSHGLTIVASPFIFENFVWLFLSILGDGSQTRYFHCKLMNWNLNISTWAHVQDISLFVFPTVSKILSCLPNILCNRNHLLLKSYLNTTHSHSRDFSLPLNRVQEISQFFWKINL